MVDNCVPQQQLGSCSVTRPFLSVRRVWVARLFHIPCSINERANSCTHIGSCLAATASCAKWCTSREHTGTSVLHFSHIRWRMSTELSHVSASICKWDSLIWSSWSKTSSAVSSWTQSSKREAGVGFLSPACFGTFRTSFRDFGSPSSTTVDCFWLALRFSLPSLSTQHINKI